MTPHESNTPSPELLAFRKAAKETFAAHRVAGPMKLGATGYDAAHARVARAYEAVEKAEAAIFAKPNGSPEAVRERFEVLRFWLVASEDHANADISHELESDDGVDRSAAHLYLALAQVLEGGARA